MEDHEIVAGCGCALFILLAKVAVIVGIVYVLIHFLLKWW